MFYYLFWRLSKNNKIKIRENMIFLIASISYLISIHFLPNPYYALIIPIDIILWIYNWCKKRNYLSILDKELEKNSNNLDEPVKTLKVIDNNLNSENTLNSTNKCLNDIYNIQKLDFLDKVKVNKRELRNVLNEEVITNNSNKIKYIPLKPDIQASLQQTVRNLGI